MPFIPYPIGTGANVIGPGSSTPGNLVAWQNSDGTVLEDTVVSVDGSGNLDGVGTVNGVKVYRALLTQSGTDAPVATVLENSFGVSLTWSRQSAGSYYLTGPNGTFNNPTPINDAIFAAGPGAFDAIYGSGSDSAYGIQTFNHTDLFSNADDVLNNYLFEITQYP